MPHDTPQAFLYAWGVVKDGPFGVGVDDDWGFSYSSQLVYSGLQEWNAFEEELDSHSQASCDTMLRREWLLSSGTPEEAIRR